MNSKIKRHISYEYKNAPIPGGGYVTGLIYHKKQAGILYARTDIGGTYRFDREERRWYSLIDHVSGERLAEAFPIAIALDDKHPEWLYIISGEYKADYGVLSISEDFGKNFTYKTVPTKVHGNLSGRGTGYRLIVDPNDSNVLYFASQVGGLWKTLDRGDNWEKLPLKEDYTTCVWVSNDSQTLVVGTAGYVTRLDDTLRGHSLYVSYDAGKNFEPLMMPENVIVEDSKMNGLVASRYDFDGTYLYVTLNSTGRWNYIVDLGYSCDTGDLIGGKVIRYFFENGKIAGYDDITPGEDGNVTTDYLNYGFGGICSCQVKPGLLACSTLCREKEKPEAIYVSEDYGNTWRISLEGLEQGGIYFRTSYMQPQYNGGVSLLHWLSDVKIDPFNPNELWFNSGTGVFTTDALLSDNPAYHDYCDGIEETVHLNVYAPLKGDVQMVDIVGDLGGFAFRELTIPCTNSFADAEGNRYITCINADISDIDSNLALITARGNWKGKTKGGLVRTTDGFKTYERIPMYFALGGKIEERMRHIERPNNNPGWVAMSPDGNNIVWSIAEDIELPVDLVIASQDGGATFRRVNVYNFKMEQVEKGLFKVFSDRVNPNLFYGFGEVGQLYVSIDGGVNFYEKHPVVLRAEYVDSISEFPVINFGLIDTINKTEIRGVAGVEGVFYMALGQDGLWKYVYDKATDIITCTKLMDETDVCYRLGLGLGEQDKDYLEGNKAIYLCGIIDGEYGFYRTMDEGKTYERLNQAHQMYGEINSIDGDKRKFGRFFVATGSRGVLYGEEA